jgi:CPA2 family monovalent cation:H+ antiporter-2
MTGSRVLIELVVVLGTAAVVTIVAQALRLPVVLGYVVAGMLIGPHVPVPLVASAELVHVLSELGVILLVFTIGLELRVATIARVGVAAGLTALFEVALVIAVGTLVARLLGFAPGPAVFAGACLGISSTMLAAKAFEERGWKTGFVEVVFAILVFEDLYAIALFAILAGVTSGAGLDAPELAMMIGKLAGFLALLLVGGLLVIPRAVRWMAPRARRETLLIAALAVCFGCAALAAEARYSVALGAFVAGVLIAESGQGEHVFELVRPFRDVFAMVFFVSVGMSIDPALLASEAPQIAAFTAVVLLLKPAAVALGVFLAGRGVHNAVRSGLALAQIGELSFVIANIAGGAELLAIAVGVSCATTLASPILVGGSERIANWVAARLPRRMATFVAFYEGWLTRLREREPTAWRRYRRSVVILVLDAGVVIAIAIAAATLGPRYMPDALLVGAALALALPFLISMVKRVGVLATRFAHEIIPAATENALDLGRAPRRALILTFELGMALAIVVPTVAAIQPFIPGSLAVVAVVGFVIAILIRRSIADFEGHVRAGSELILELLVHPPPQGAPLAQVETLLPGFGGAASHVLADGASAIGRSLAELDLRARTGATVLAIGRGETGLATPSPTEPLQRGDVLALAGSDDAIAAARRLLDDAA